MRGAIPPLPQYFMAWCLVKHRGNFTFYPAKQRSLLAEVKNRRQAEVGRHGQAGNVREGEER
jgi:hypothetical protein